MKKGMIVVLGLVLLMALAASFASAQICTAVDDIEDPCNPPNDVPEFGVIGAGLALAGAAGYSIFRRKK